MPPDVQDNKGKSPLDLALQGFIRPLDTAVYLMNHGCDSHEDKVKILYRACQLGELTVVKELVEQHNINSKGNISLNQHHQ